MGSDDGGSVKYNSDCNLDLILGELGSHEARLLTKPEMIFEMAIDKTVKMQVFKNDKDLTLTDSFKIHRQK